MPDNNQKVSHFIVHHGNPVYLSSLCYIHTVLNDRLGFPMYVRQLVVKHFLNRSSDRENESLNWIKKSPLFHHCSSSTVLLIVLLWMAISGIHVFPSIQIGMLQWFRFSNQGTDHSIRTNQMSSGMIIFLRFRSVHSCQMIVFILHIRSVDILLTECSRLKICILVVLLVLLIRGFPWWWNFMGCSSFVCLRTEFQTHLPEARLAHLSYLQWRSYSAEIHKPVSKRARTCVIT
jgi:hypothetical protein